MRLSLKKFTDDPYKNIKHAPLILEVSGKPKYAIIPYSLYREIRDKTAPDMPSNDIYVYNPAPKHQFKLPARLHKLLFE